MQTIVVPGNAPVLANAIAHALGVESAPASVERFPDGESHVAVPGVVARSRVVLVQSLAPPVNDHLVELLLLMDAARRSGAVEMLVAIPYVGYARQDRRSDGDAVGVRVVVDAITSRSPTRLFVVDPHIASFEAVGGVPVDTVTAVAPLAGAIRDALGEGARDAVVVAPDLGAVKLAERYATELQLPTAVVRKRRISGSAVVAHDLVGDVRGLRAVIVDDMLSTGGTIEAAVTLLIERGAVPPVTVAATHGLFVGPAVERLRALPVARFIVTDTVPSTAAMAALPLAVVSVADVLAGAISRHV